MALTKVLWSGITDLVTTGLEVKNQLEAAFTTIDTAIDQIDVNTADIATANTLNDFSYEKVTNFTVTNDVYEEVVAYLQDKPAGTYQITQSMLYSLNSTVSSAFFRFSINGGITWTEVRREPKDNLDKEPLSNSFVIVHDGGNIDIRIQARKETSSDVLAIYSLDLIVDRKL